MDWQQTNEDYHRIEKAIHYLDQHQHEHPSLSKVANEIGLSEYHFQRLFTRWAGVSPKRFLQYLTKEHAKKILEQSSSLLDATFLTGLSSPGRLHDLFVSCEAVTPGEYKQHGMGLEISYGFHPSPFGKCLIAVTDRGICSLYFLEEQDEESARKALYQQWQEAVIKRDQSLTGKYFEQAFASYFMGNNQAGIGKSEPLQLHLIGTNFQLKVWEALLDIPMGKMVSYDELSTHIGYPRASRAVGNALSRNQVSLLIPCHRVIKKVGSFGNYRWGPDRKRAIVGWEMARVSQ